MTNLTGPQRARAEAVVKAKEALASGNLLGSDAKRPADIIELAEYILEGKPKVGYIRVAVDVVPRLVLHHRAHTTDRIVEAASIRRALADSGSPTHYRVSPTGTVTLGFDVARPRSCDASCPRPHNHPIRFI